MAPLVTLRRLSQIQQEADNGNVLHGTAVTLPAAAVGGDLRVAGRAFVSPNGGAPARAAEIVDAAAPQLRLTRDATHFVDLSADGTGQYSIAPSGGATNIAGSLTVSGNISAANYPGGVSGPPSGPASGDLGASYPNPTVLQLQGQPLPATAADGFLKRNHTNGGWELASWAGGIPSPNTVTQGNDARLSDLRQPRGPVPSGGDLSGDFQLGITVKGLQGNNLPTGVANGFLKRNSINNGWEEVAYGNAANTVTQGNDIRLSDSRPPGGAAGGDLAGSAYNTGPFIAPGVVTNAKLALMPARRLKGNDSASTAAANDLTVTQIAALLGGTTHDTLAFGDAGSGPPSGAASNDLGGSYPGPTVVGVQGQQFAALNSANGFLKRTSGNTAWEEVGYGTAANTVCAGNDGRLSDPRTPLGTAAATGDLAGSAYASLAIAAGVVTNTKLALMSGQRLKGNDGAGSSAPLDLTVAQVAALLGGTTHNTLAFGDAGSGPPSGAAGGDLGGSYPGPTVVGLRGQALPANAGDGFLKRNAANTGWESVGFGSAANTVTQGNDPRFTGPAGGDLGASYPSPTVLQLNGQALPANVANGVLKRNGANSGWEEWAVVSGGGVNTLVPGNDPRLSGTSLTDLALSGHLLVGATPLSGSPPARAEVVDGANPQLRLTRDGTHFADLEADGANLHLTISNGASPPGFVWSNKFFADDYFYGNGLMAASAGPHIQIQRGGHLSNLSADSNGALVLTPGGGTVGINTTATPARALEVLDAANPPLRISRDATNFVDFSVTAGGDLGVTPSGGDSAFTGNLAVTGNLAASVAGDLSGTLPNPTVAKLQGLALAAPVGGDVGKVLTVATGPALAWQTPTGGGGGGPPTGAAGGDLLGSTYPNPVIAAAVVTRAKIAADAWLSPIPNAGGADLNKVLTVGAGPTLAWVTPSGGGSVGPDLALTGRLAVGTATVPSTVRSEMVDPTNPQLRLTQTAGTTFADFQLDAAGNLAVLPSGFRFGINGAPAATLAIAGFQPAAVSGASGTTADPLLIGSGAPGGNNSIATTGSGGSGASATLTSGTGGQATAAATASSGGLGGSFTLQGGLGGAAAVAGSGTNNGGAGGAFQLNGGAGGAATGSTSGTNSGGTGGNLVITAGIGGAATTGSGTLTGGAGGALVVSAGTAGAGVTANSGGAATFQGGAAANAVGSNGGTCTVQGRNGSGTTTGGSGGGLTLKGGDAGGDNTVNRTGGTVTVTGGLGKGNNAGATVTITGGAGGLGVATTGGIGGAVSLVGGPGAANTTGGAGAVTNVTGGLGGNGSTTNGSGGLVAINGGDKGTGAGTGGTVGNVALANTRGLVGVGTAAPVRILSVLDGANPQLRLAQAISSIYTDFQTDATGRLTVTPTGSLITLTGDVTVTGRVISPIPINAQSGTTYSLVAADAYKCIEGTNAAAQTYTIDAATFANIGDCGEICQLGAGQITVAAGGSTVLRSDGAKVKTAAQYATIAWRKRSTTEVVLSGDLA